MGEVTPNRNRSLLVATVGTVLALVAMWRDVPRPLRQAPPWPSLNHSQLTGPIRRVLGMKIPLNTARVSDLTALPGIGLGKARGIVTYRQSQGPFTSLEDLQGVPGIGKATLDKIRPFLNLEPTGNN